MVAVDCPYTFSDAEGLTRDTRWARRLGYVAKSLVDAAHAPLINGIFSPDEQELRCAHRLVAAFEAARAAGEARVELDGALVEVPAFHNAKRLLARGEALRKFERGDLHRRSSPRRLRSCAGFDPRIHHLFKKRDFSKKMG